MKRYRIRLWPSNGRRPAKPCYEKIYVAPAEHAIHIGYGHAFLAGHNPNTIRSEVIEIGEDSRK